MWSLSCSVAAIYPDFNFLLLLIAFRTTDSVFWWSKSKQKENNVPVTTDLKQMLTEFRVQELYSLDSETCLCRHTSHVNHYVMSGRKAYEVFSVSFWLVVLWANLGDAAVKIRGAACRIILSADYSELLILVVDHF